MAAIAPAPLVWLPSATSPSIAQPHRYYVKAPVLSGTQPAVIEIWEHGKPSGFDGEVIVLPNAIPYEEAVHNPVYSACLKVMAMDYRAVINRASKSKEIIEWSNLSWNEPPFTTVLQRRTQGQLSALLRALCSAHLPGGESLESINSKILEAALWTPVHLTDVAKAAHSKGHWIILKNWDRWEAGAFEWLRRYREWIQFLGEEPSDERGKGVDSMRKLCRWMGLTNIKSQPTESERFDRKYRRAMMRQKKGR